MTLDILVIGSGSGGHVAAIRAGQIGMKTAIVERWLPAPARRRRGASRPRPPAMRGADRFRPGSYRRPT
jgi:2-polyprenyl-6-methoxyphenol hydroxylase-like FAD-dependent oxidoreductase